MNGDAFCRLSGRSGRAGRSPEYKNQALACLKVERGDRIVEVGCGTGRDVPALAEHFGPDGAVLGIDANAEIIAEARRRAAGTGLPVSFEVVDGTDFRSLADDSFDAARMDRVLHLVPEPCTSCARWCASCGPAAGSW